MTFALVAGTEKMNILRTVLDVTRPTVLVYDIKQHSCNMARAHNIKIPRFAFAIHRILHFLDYI